MTRRITTVTYDQKYKELQSTQDKIMNNLHYADIDYHDGIPELEVRGQSGALRLCKTL